ncbi:MAG: bifunctional folylpolyglutamate synthase/dihydrofolate synthase [Bacteroidia bacterium]|nr:bifunctional folylpolyglutamate synthase/dihydrofolate synthase [Bacteroidia bacterium]
MNYNQTLEYMYSQLPMFQRIGTAAYKDNLDNTIAICKLLKNPEKKFKSIHIAGTNGKGSTSHMLASILQSAGYRVGLYTSPHLKDFRERIKINGRMISKSYVTSFIKKNKTNFEKISPSFFEMTVGLAFDYFANSNIDIAIIEVGLGGRLDSTNVIQPELSIITNISFDHTNLLGNTLQKIATEKAGIIKKKTPVVIGETQKVTEHIFRKKAKEQHSKIYFADQLFTIKNTKHSADKKIYLQCDIWKDDEIYLKKLESELLGLYQEKNICTVVAACAMLPPKYNIQNKNIRKGIKHVVSKTGLLGRWQVLSQSPLTICDTGHNEAGIKQVLTQLKLMPYKQLHFVLGMVNDKDISTILKLLPPTAKYYFCRASIPRALDANELKKQANLIGLKGKVYHSVSEALSTAQKKAKAEDLVFIGGSTFTVAEIV